MQPLVSRTPMASPSSRSSQEHHWQAHATTRLKNTPGKPMQPLVSRTPLASPCNRSSQEHHWQAHATTRLKSRAKTKSDMRQINGPITTKAWVIIGRNTITNGTVIWYVQIISNCHNIEEKQFKN